MGDTDDSGQSPLWHEFDQFLAYIEVNPGHRPLALEPGVGGASSTDAMDVLEVRSVDWETAQNVDEIQAGLLASQDMMNEPMDCENGGVFDSWDNFSDALLETTLNAPPTQSAKAGYANDFQESIAVTTEMETSVVEKPTIKEIATNGGTVSVLNNDGKRKRKRAVDKSSIKLLIKLASSIADLQPTDDTFDEKRDSQKKLKSNAVEEVEHYFSKPLGDDSAGDSKLHSDNTLVAFTVSDFDAICKLAITHAALEDRTVRPLPRVKLKPQPAPVCNSDSKPAARYHIVELYRGMPKSSKNMLKAQGLQPAPPIQKRKQTEKDSVEVVQRKRKKPDIPMPLHAASNRKNRVTSAVPMIPRIAGQHMNTRASNMDAMPSTSGTTGSAEAELPKQSVDGRRHPNVPSKYRCGTCHKIYLGKRMQRHQFTNPTHRTVAQMEDEISKSIQEDNVQPSISTELTLTGKDKGQQTGRLNQLIQIVSAEPEPNRTRLMQEFWQQMRDLTPNLTDVAMTEADPKVFAQDLGNPNIGQIEQPKTLHQNVQHMMQFDQDNSAPGGPVMGGGLVRPNVPRAVNAAPLGRMDTPAALPNVSILDELLATSGIQLLDDLSVLELDQHDLF
ncbi:uncharacterized protein LOC125959878 [Anopheles darlingi]|uniref:uncharacterized protein LOC125959878 n=1 Tax=Anopheles darlingi TaxID=43151 RepID=UPI0020FFFEA7|nr:uncharacterized protein LOC125959878 [Anopheles darlingi]